MTEEWYFFIVIFIFYFSGTYIYIYVQIIFTMVYYKILNIVPLIFMSISVPIPFCFDYYSFERSLTSEIVIALALFFFLLIAFTIWGLMWCHTNFRTICFRDFDRDCSKSVVQTFLTILTVELADGKNKKCIHRLDQQRGSIHIFLCKSCALSNILLNYS